MISFLFDLDGVIYRDTEPMPGAADTVAALRAAGHRVLFATNNATRSRAEFIERLEGVGVPARLEEIGTSAYATALYLRDLPTPPRSAFVLGAQALADELAAVGIRAAEPDEQPDCVVASLDRAFTYERLVRAQQAVLGGALLIATNRDPRFPGAHGSIRPGAGSIVAAVETACQRQATSIGKPGPLLYQTLLASSGAETAHALTVGDNLDTDIAAANAMGLASILVLTGISRRSDLAHSTARPDLVVETLPELLEKDLEALLRR